MNKKGVHLVGRDICSPLPLTISLSNVILRCRNQMDNELICLKESYFAREMFCWMSDVFVFVRLPRVCSTSQENETGMINHTSDSLQAFAYCHGR